MKFGILAIAVLCICASNGLTYFQQHVNYKIRVKLIPELNRLEGEQKMVYLNNSPDTLRYIYFHLYMNRFRRTAESDSIPAKNAGYIEIISVKDSLDRELQFQTDGTVMKLELPLALAPGDSQEFFFRFNTILPPAGERFGYYGDHFDVGNWYPVPAVYDERGWHADQHVDGEFYQEWGSFWVDVTVPNGFVVGATGALLNPEALPDSVSFAKRRTDYWNFPDSTPVTYRFHAPRVHDFAWTADPEFVLRHVDVNGIDIQFFILSYRMKDWESQLPVAKKAVELFEQKVGPYPYPSLAVVDGFIKAGGIEYPNLVIINDLIYDPRDLSATIIHEIAHQWFYGLLANNQTRYGWMDEGFATYFENLGMEKVFGDKPLYIDSPSGFWGKYFGYSEDVRETDFLTYLAYIRTGQEERINLNFDWFQYNPYIPYYQKMSLVISQLKLVLGDSLFWKGMHQYYDTWRFRHPYPEDLFRVFGVAGGQNLSWFFEEWLNTIWHCDYAVGGFGGTWEKQNDRRIFDAHLKFKRNQPVVMPLDFRLFLADGSTRDYRVPVAGGTNFIAGQDTGISPWKFYEKEKQVRLRLPAKIKRVLIDPENRLLDVNPFNNDSRRFPRIYWYWLHRQYLYPRTDGYTATVFPFIFYNREDGIQLGIRTRGNYIYPDFQHRSEILFGIRSRHPDIDLWFEHPLYILNPQLHFVARAYNSGGRRGGGTWLQWTAPPQFKDLKFTAGWQFRHIYEDAYFPFVPGKGNISYLEGTVSRAHWKSGYQPFGWEAALHGENAFLGSDYTFNLWTAEASFRVPLVFYQKLTGRFFSGAVYGDVPVQKELRTGGASGYDLFLNPYTRSIGTLPADWWHNGHVFIPGGGNMRVFADAWEPQGRSLVSGTVAVTLGNPLNLSLHYVPYISDIVISGFTDWVSTANNWGDFRRFYGEAGATITLSRLPFLFHYFDIDEIHFDFPFWVNRNVDQEKFKFRWSIRVDFRSFY